MKITTLTQAILSTFILLISFQLVSAQVSNFRPYNQNGNHIFEPAKELNTTFEKPFVRVGGSFTQQYQGLEHGNEADVVLDADGTTNLNELYDLGKGFNLATANLNLDFHLLLKN